MALVKKGDLLLKIKPDYYQALFEQEEANLAAAKASAVQAKAELLKSQGDFQRSQDLYAKQLISESDYVAAKTALEVAEAVQTNSLAQIRRTEGSVNQARDQLGKTVIYSPMDGTISSLISESRCCPAARMRSTASRSSWLRSDSSSSWAKPRTAFSGVRSSWLVLDRNAFLARVAVSA